MDCSKSSNVKVMPPPPIIIKHNEIKMNLSLNNLKELNKKINILFKHNKEELNESNVELYINEEKKKFFFLFYI